MKIRLIISLLLFNMGISYAQDCNYTVSGKILDAHSQEIIPFATIQIQGTTSGTVADINGEFTIKDICEKEIDLIFTHIGYRTLKHHHDVFHDVGVILLAPDDKLLESIIIEGEYNPANQLSVALREISSQKLAESKSESLGELLSQLTGVSMLSTGQNISKPVIHGLHSNRVLIINNGVRHEFQNWGVEHAPEIDPTQAGSVSIVKGASTVRYGPDALGGVILIDPPILQLHSGFSGELGTVGSLNGRSGEANLNITQGWDHLIVGIQGSVLKQGDLNTPDYVLSNTGKNEESWSARMRYHSSHSDWEVFFSHFNQNLGILRGSVNGNLTDLALAMESEIPNDTKPFAYTINTPRQEVAHDLLKIRGVITGDGQDLSIQYAYQKNKRQEYDLRRGTNNEIPSIDLRLQSHSLDIDWNHPTFGSLSGTAGIQGLLQVNDNIPGTNTVPFVPNYIQNRIGAYLIEQIESGHTIFEAGIRYDYQYWSVKGRQPDNTLYSNDLSFSQITGSLGFRNKKGPLVFRSNIGTAWRPPNVSELYSFGKHQASILYGLWRYELDENNEVISGNILDERDKKISPEMGIKWISSLEKQEHEIQWDITTYVNYIRNFIYMRPSGITNTVRGAFPYFIFGQTNALLAGIDAGITIHPSEKLDIETQLSYVYAKDISNNDVFVEIPPGRIGINVRYEISSNSLDQSSIALSNNYTLRYFQEPRVISINEILAANLAGNNLFATDNSTFDFTQAPDPYFLTSLLWTASKNRISWILECKNLFNTRYRVYTDRLRYFSDQTGRQIKLTLNYKFSKP